MAQGQVLLETLQCSERILPYNIIMLLQGHLKNVAIATGTMCSAPSNCKGLGFTISLQLLWGCFTKYCSCCGGVFY
jgi:hypothetical protein